MPRWSPDAQRIAFAAASPGHSWNVWLISRDGGSAEQLTSDGVISGDPAWSPDGNSLAFGILGDSAGETAIRMLNLQTRQFVELDGSRGIFAPRWSPDGRHIVAITFDSKKLMLFDFKTNRWRSLFVREGSIGYISWSPDSAYVYFDNQFTEDSSFLRVRIQDAKIERVVDLKGTRLFSSTFGPWTGITPEEEPLLVRDQSSQEVYALELQVR